MADISIINVMIKNLCNLSNKKLNTILSLIIGVLGKRCVGGGGEEGLNKCNQWKIIKIS